jgi:hypothetical protein
MRVGLRTLLRSRGERALLPWSASLVQHPPTSFIQLVVASAGRGPDVPQRACLLHHLRKYPARSNQVPGRVDTSCRAAVRGQPIGRGGHRLSRWHPRPPACPQRYTTAEWAPGGMRDRLPPGRSLHRPAGIRLRAWQPGAFPEGPGPLSPTDTGPGPGSIRTAPQRAAPIAAATAKNHSMQHLLHRVRAAANAVNMRRYCAGLLEPFRKRAGWLGWPHHPLG